ncbi:hypothetical protein [Thiocystis minor]|uniref:hypothetical protein n=1 Tax=Thiocystis minor TaxID=61597 RepID=UPI001F5C81BE|nr:hypothetical protein [Thiocystis minor]
MQWQEVCEHLSLRDLPFKIETNEKGEIVMNAVKVIHSLFQGRDRVSVTLAVTGWKNLA